MCSLCKPKGGYGYGGGYYNGDDFLYNYGGGYGLTFNDFAYDPFEKPKDEPNPANELPRVGQVIYLHDTEGLPVGSIVKSNKGGLYARGSVYNTDAERPSFLIPLGEEKLSLYSTDKFTIQYIPEWPTKFEVGDVVSHAQAQLLPRFTVLVYEPDEWYKHLSYTSSDTSGFQSHWYVTDRKVSNRCGVVKPMNGENHWSSFYRIVYLPESAK